MFGEVKLMKHLKYSLRSYNLSNGFPIYVMHYLLQILMVI